MDTDIFIPTSNRFDALKQCLESLNKQSKKGFRILLVGIKDDDQVRRMLSRFRDLKIDYFIQKKKGIIGAANEALKRAENEIFVRLDDDVVLDKDWYKNLIKTFKSDKNIGGVTGPTTISEKGMQARDLTNFLEGIQHSTNPVKKLFGRVYLDFLYEGKIKEPSKFLSSGVFTLGSNYPETLKLKHNRQADYLEACNWSARTRLVKQIGGFDEIFTEGLGDYHETDSAMKIKNLGYKLIFNPQVKLRHNVETGKVEKARPAAYHRMQNFIIFYFRFFKIKSLNQLLKFSTNLCLQNGYYGYKFLTTGRLNQLGGLLGTFSGLTKVLFLRRFDNQS